MDGLRTAAFLTPLIWLVDACCLLSYSRVSAHLGLLSVFSAQRSRCVVNLGSELRVLGGFQVSL